MREHESAWGGGAFGWDLKEGKAQYVDRKDARWGGEIIGSGVDTGVANIRRGRESEGTNFQKYQAKIK